MITIVLSVLPNGEYRMSQTDVGRAIKVNERLVRHFLNQKQSKALPGKDFRLDKISIIDDSSERGGRGQINGITLDAANDFWIESALFG